MYLTDICDQRCLYYERNQRRVKLGVMILKYSVIKKDGLNFVSLYSRIRTSDKYDVNYV